MAVSGRRSRLGVGDVLDGRFKLVAELGEGGMSRVYEAVDLKYDRAAAVKVLARWLAEDEEFRQRFERESIAAERVNHPHVLPVWHHGDQDGLLYLVTPLCDTDVGGLLDDRGPLEPSRALAIIAQVAWALDWAHGRGVVHRDVKPENILLVSGPGDDHAYIADFGLAKSNFESTLTQAGHPAGLTPAYAAPEQWLGEAVGPAADQYALAATLYTCLTGHPPFHPRRGPSLREAHLSESAPELDSVVPGIPTELARAIAQGLAKSPSQRFGTCRDLVTAAQIALQRERHAGMPVPGEPVAPAASATVLSSEVSGPDAPPTPPAFAPPPPGSTEPSAPWAEVDERRSASPVSAPGLPVPSTAGVVSVSPGEVAAAELPAVEAAPALAGADERARPDGPDGPRSRRRIGLTVAGVVLAALAVAALVVVLGGGSEDPSAPSRAPVGNVRQIPVGAAPIALAAGTGGVWVANSGADTLTRIAPREGVVRETAIRAVANPFGVAVVGDRVWVVGPEGDLVALDAQTGRPLTRANLDISADGLAAGFGAVWILNGTADSVTRVDVESGQVGAQRVITVGKGPSDIAVGADGVWVVNSVEATLVKLAPTTGKVVGARTRLPGAPDAVAVDGGAVWVTNAGKGLLLRIDSNTRKVTEIPVGSAARDADVAVGDGAVFYVNHTDGTALRVDPRTARPVGKPIRATTSPVDAVVAARALWVADNETNTVARLGF